MRLLRGQGCEARRASEVSKCIGLVASCLSGHLVAEDARPLSKRARRTQLRGAPNGGRACVGGPFGGETSHPA